MASDKKAEDLEPAVKELKAELETSLAQKDVPSWEGVQSGLVTTSGNAASSSGEGKVFGGLGGSSRTTRSYQYQYPGSTQPVENSQDHGNNSKEGIQSDTSSYACHLSGYNQHGAGSISAFDGQQAFIPSRYDPNQVLYGSEAPPCYAWDSTYFEDVVNGNAFGSANAVPGSRAVPNSNSLGSPETDRINPEKLRMLAIRQPVKSPSEGYNPAWKPSCFTNQRKQTSPMSYSSNARMWNHGDRLNKLEKFTYFEAAAELTCGPRGKGKLGASQLGAEKEESFFAVNKDMYNLPDFQTVYENAKFYIIKSYSEDDIHKSIKYCVWSSTPNGNKKLDAAFRSAESDLASSGKRCPIFLFFSVNASGQFVGVAEIMGVVDFQKDMDFWKLDKWIGFFPVQWHIIKDVPNRALCHIIIDVRENRPVTYTRDTQEIGLDQGLQMLKIFKNYPAKTSLLDDFGFYEDREESLRAKRMSKPPATLRMAMEKSTASEDEVTPIPKQADRNTGHTRGANIPGTLLNLTRNLSIDGRSSRGNAVKHRTKNELRRPPAP